MMLPAKIESVVSPVLDRMGLVLVMGSFRREGSGKVLRLLVEQRDATATKGSGVDIGLCAIVSREISTALDVSDIVDDAYTLEVSSPGVERPLVRLDDFIRFAGSRTKIRTKQPVEGTRHFEGTLKGVENGDVVLTTRDDRKVSIPKELIQQANLVFEFRR